jgi:PEP-CTERM motif
MKIHPSFSLLLVLSSLPAVGAMYNQPVAPNAYITQNGLDWAWGGPCPYVGGCGGTGDLSYQSQFGWRLPTGAELSSLPVNFYTYFVFQGANVPAYGTDPVSGSYFAAGSPGAPAACAATYFDIGNAWCDWNDGVRDYWAGLPPGDQWWEFYGEQLYVRSATPEPGTLALVGSAMLGFGAVRRRIFS